jgi:Zn-dependent protease with chaperone function
MHLIIICAALAAALSIRHSVTNIQGNWNWRWRQALFLFLFPPLLVFSTAIALLCMGTQGRMGIWQTGCISYVFAFCSLFAFVTILVKLAYQGFLSIESTRNCPLILLEKQPVRLLNTQAMFAGQIGFWHPELVISEGLLQNLSPAHLETVLAHEQGHYHYRDTFWFFWLGWIRECTAWLPNSATLWEELLLLRELRADARAASQVDPLLLAESLLLVVSNQTLTSDVLCAALGSSSHGDRLEQRIEALLTIPESSSVQVNHKSWHYFLLALLPLVTVLFHQ